MEETETKNTTIKLLSFKLGEDEFGINIQNVNTIIENNFPVTRVPGTLPYIIGVINLRGEIIPILDLRYKLGFDNVRNDDDETKIIIVNIEGTIVGIKVDRVLDVVQIDIESIEIFSDLENKNTYQYYSGIVKANDKIILLLDIDKVLFS